MTDLSKTRAKVIEAQAHVGQIAEILAEIREMTGDPNHADPQAIQSACVTDELKDLVADVNDKIMAIYGAAVDAWRADQGLASMDQSQ